jgi:hypothetical protein
MDDRRKNRLLVVVESCIVTIGVITAAVGSRLSYAIGPAWKRSSGLDSIGNRKQGGIERSYLV